jgi:hypothetical protein
MREINFEFEELPLGSIKTADGLVCQIEVTAWGRAVIAYGADDWTVRHIEIDASAKVDGRWVTRGAPLDAHHPLSRLIADALRTRENERILERIVDDMREAGLLPFNPAVEHSTLNHRQQGIAR